MLAACLVARAVAFLVLVAARHPRTGRCDPEADPTGAEATSRSQRDGVPPSRSHTDERTRRRRARRRRSRRTKAPDARALRMANPPLRRGSPLGSAANEDRQSLSAPLSALDPRAKRRCGVLRTRRRRLLPRHQRVPHRSSNACADRPCVSRHRRSRLGSPNRRRRRVGASRTDISRSTLSSTPDGL